MAKAINFRFLLFLLFAFLFVYALFFLSSENLKISKRRVILGGEIKRLQAEVISQNQENLLSSSGAAGFLSGDYLEKVAREDLNLKKEGEQSVVVQLPDVLSPQKKDFLQQEVKSFWQKIWARVAQW